MHLATMALLCKQTTDNSRTGYPPERRWRHLSGNRILFVPHCDVEPITHKYFTQESMFSRTHYLLTRTFFQVLFQLTQQKPAYKFKVKRLTRGTRNSNTVACSMLSSGSSGKKEQKLYTQGESNIRHFYELTIDDFFLKSVIYSTTILMIVESMKFGSMQIKCFIHITQKIF